MTEVERFDPYRQRVALQGVADSGMEFFTTAEGAALLEQLETYFAAPIVKIAKGWGYPLDREDVTHMIIERLVTDRHRRAEKSVLGYMVAASGEPWGYLWSCTRRWAQETWGTRGTSLDAVEHFLTQDPSDEDTHLTPLSVVVDRTFEVLATRTAEHHHAALLELLGWLAANPPERLSYEADDRVHAHRYCPTLSIEQVTAIMNIAWGGRPRQAETSLMGQFLLNENFRPSDSPTHIRALVYYKTAMRAGEHGSRMLTDWSTQ